MYKEQAVQAYYEFLDGRRTIGNTNIYLLAMPTREPVRRYDTRYAIIDSSGDEIPELHIKLSKGEWDIISYENGELIWFKCMEDGGSGGYYLLKNGAYMYFSDRSSECFFKYFELDESGNEINEIRFYWEENNGNYIPDEEDEFYFNGAACTKEEWLAKTEAYLYIDENDRAVIRNTAEWRLYCEGGKDPYEINSQVVCDVIPDGYQLTLYDREHREVYSASYPESMWIDSVTENILEIGISVGSPARYTYYFNREMAQISDTFFNAVLFGDGYIAYMKEDMTDKEAGILVLSDIFHEGILYQEITRDFSRTADPMSAIISVEMTDHEDIKLEYYKGEEFEVETEIIGDYRTMHRGRTP